MNTCGICERSQEGVVTTKAQHDAQRGCLCQRDRKHARAGSQNDLYQISVKRNDMKARNSSVSRGTYRLAYTTVHPHQPSAHHPSCRLRRALTPHGVHRPGRSTGPCGKCLINVREHHSSESYMSQHALNNLITHAAKQRPRKRAGP